MSDNDRWGRTESSDAAEKDTTVAQPEAVTPSNSGTDVTPQPETSVDDNQPEPGETVTTPEGESDQEGVKVGGLTYTQNADGTRSYEGQEPVKTSGDPTPTPEA